jgi:hypothetical protein
MASKCQNWEFMIAPADSHKNQEIHMTSQHEDDTSWRYWHWHWHGDGEWYRYRSNSWAHRIMENAAMSESGTQTTQHRSYSYSYCCYIHYVTSNESPVEGHADNDTCIAANADNNNNDGKAISLTTCESTVMPQHIFVSKKVSSKFQRQLEDCYAICGAGMSKRIHSFPHVFPILVSTICTTIMLSKTYSTVD